MDGNKPLLKKFSTSLRSSGSSRRAEKRGSKSFNFGRLRRNETERKRRSLSLTCSNEEKRRAEVVQPFSARLRSGDQTGWRLRLMAVMNVANSQEKAAARRCEEPLVSKIPAALQGHFTTSTNNSDLRLTDKHALKVNKMLIFLFSFLHFHLLMLTERHGRVA